jgi:hypothetical protein
LREEPPGPIVGPQAALSSGVALDRGVYHVQQTPFPMAFIRIDGQFLLAHATGWNRVDLSDPAAGALVTPQQFHAAEPRGRPAHYLDYFYGALYPSPDGGLIVTDGWVRHPVGMPRVWDTAAGGTSMSTKPRTASRPAACGRSAATGIIRCAGSMTPGWLSAGIGADNEAMIPGVEIYDARSATLLASFAGPVGPLHCERERLFASSPRGLQIWDVRTGAQTGTVPGLALVRYHAGSHELAAIDDGALAT